MRQSFYIGVKAIIPQADEILILKDASKGKWELPGGRIDGAQSIEEAISREIPEEIVAAKFLRLGELVHAAVGDFSVENDHRLCLLFYLADIVLPEVIELSEEHTESAFIGADAVDDYDMFTTDRAAITKYFTNRS